MSWSGLTSEEVASRLSGHQPKVGAAERMGPKAAATALILAPGAGGLEVLFMLRTERTGDRWSGHVSLPGGRRDEGDADVLHTARRETEEEVGLVLADPIGRIRDIGGRATRMSVATFVFGLDAQPSDLVLDPVEVQDTFWVPVSFLAAPKNVRLHWEKGIGPFPCVRWDGQTIWGLTWRIMREFFAAVR